jgi:hypothetical protein
VLSAGNTRPLCVGSFFRADLGHERGPARGDLLVRAGFPDAGHDRPVLGVKVGKVAAGEGGGPRVGPRPSPGGRAARRLLHGVVELILQQVELLVVGVQGG